MALDSFEELFGPDCRGEVAALFRRALDGEAIDRAPLRYHARDGRVLEFELNLSQRQKAGNPLAVRCLLREVTQQKQREHRLALQLVVSQIVGENASPEVASMRDPRGPLRVPGMGPGHQVAGERQAEAA